MEMAERRSPTLSPSMDIQVSCNFERLLFELLGRDGAAVAELMLPRSAPRARSRSTPTASALLAEHWSGAGVDDDGTTARSSPTSTRERGVLVDPHTAVGLGAAARSRRRDPTVPMVCLATAHPAKFPDAVEAATGVRPPLPAACRPVRPRRALRRRCPTTSTRSAAIAIDVRRSPDTSRDRDAWHDAR